MSDDPTHDEPQPEPQEPSADAAGEERIIPIAAARQDEQPAAPETPPADAAEPEGDGEPEAGELDQEELKGIVEALLFSSASPLSAAKIAELAGIKGARTIRNAVEALKQEYDSHRRAFTVEEIAGGFQLMTRPEFHTWVGRLRFKEQEETLSQAALETLAIIAYRQPVTRADIESIRGVQSGYILRSLIEKALVRVAGRSEELGRPLLYGTTNKFLEAFGLPSLKALPKLDEAEAKSP